MIGLIAFILVFGILVISHEWGHLFMAKRAGIHCPEFAIGMGPKLFSFKKNDTKYTLRLLPFGGYVRMAGSELDMFPINKGMRLSVKLNDDNKVTHLLFDDQHNFKQIDQIEVVESNIYDDLTITGIDQHTGEQKVYYLSEESYRVENGVKEKIAPKAEQFDSKTPLQKFLTLFAGPFMNFVLALVILCTVAMIQGAPSGENVIGGIGEDSPAEKAGLKTGDVITQINGNKINSWDDMREVMQQTNGKETKVMIERNGEISNVQLTPTVQEIKQVDGSIDKRYILGVNNKLSFSPVDTIPHGFYITYEAGTRIAKGIVFLFTSIFTGEFSLDMLNGPVGIYKVTEQVASQGLINLMAFTGLLSVNLGLMNLLPIPALDGGRILFVLYEAIFRKPIHKKAEVMIQLAGALFVLILMVLVTWNDIKTFFL